MRGTRSRPRQDVADDPRTAGDHGPHTVLGRRTPITGTGRRIGSGFMICRVWRGWTTKDNADAYERVVRGEVIPGIEARRIPGFRSIDLVRRERDHDVEFMTLMWFDTIDSVKAFMGADYETAHVPEQAQAVLADFDKRSVHYEVLDRREQSL
jgi:heme-degrading monooxygenase HmoA